MQPAAFISLVIKPLDAKPIDTRQAMVECRDLLTGERLIENGGIRAMSHTADQDTIFAFCSPSSE